MLVSVIQIRMGGAKRNPSSLFVRVVHVSLGLLRVFASSRERLSFRDNFMQLTPPAQIGHAFQ